MGVQSTPFHNLQFIEYLVFISNIFLGRWTYTEILRRKGFFYKLLDKVQLINTYRENEVKYEE